MSKSSLLGLVAQISDLHANPELLRNEPRDIELHDLFMSIVLAGNWWTMAEQVHDLLLGDAEVWAFTGRSGDWTSRALA